MDLCIGIGLVLLGAIAMMAFSAQAFVGKPGFGKFTDAAGVATGLEAYAGRLPGVLFAIGLIDASLIGAAAVSLATAYALGDVFAVRHSLHRQVTDVKGFYGVYCALIVAAAALVLVPGVPLGLLTNAVQTLAGVLLRARPSSCCSCATTRRCSDLGPTGGRRTSSPAPSSGCSS